MIRLLMRTMEEHWLLIEDIDFEDAGDYFCEATNGVGEDKSCSINTESLASHRFIVKPKRQTLKEGEQVIFESKISFAELYDNLDK